VTQPRITEKDLEEKNWHELFNRADKHVADKYQLDIDDAGNYQLKKMWEETFVGITVELDANGNFGDIVFDSEESYTMFLSQFS